METLIVLITTFVVLLIVAVVYIDPFRRKRLDANGLTVGNALIPWDQIESIANIGAGFLPVIQIKVPRTSHILIPLFGFSRFTEAVEHSGMFEVCARGIYGQPMRWKRIGQAYTNTGMFDAANGVSLAFINAKPSGDPRLVPIVMGAFIIGLMLVLAILIIPQ